MRRYTRLGLVAVLALLALVSIALAGSRSTAWLGVYTQEVDADIADAFSLEVDYGAIVNDVVRDSPAESAGLEEDDIIIAFNDNKVRDDDDLTDLVQDSKPGDTVTLTVLRKGTEQKVRVELGRRPSYSGWYDEMKWFDAPDVPKAPRSPVSPRSPRAYSFHFGERPYIGVSLIALSDRTAQALGAEKGGVLIDDVSEDSPAEKAGLKPGDLIVAIDDENVFEVDDIQHVIQDKEEGEVARLVVVRERQKTTIEVKVEIDEDGDTYGRPDVIRIPNLSSLKAPGVHGMYFGVGPTWDEEDSDEYREDMKELQQELKKLKEELGELKKTMH